MKRLIPLIVCMIFLCGCISINKEKEEQKTPDNYMSGVWVTYSEVNEMLRDGNFKENFNKCLEKCKDMNITDIFIHTRAFCDSLYPSKFFPQNELSAKYDFDVFEYLIEKSHGQGIKVHAWINPYRVKTSDENINNLPENSPIKKLKKDIDYGFCGGIFLLPSSENVKRLITDGIREICENYKIDGIHFDDYFYPTAAESFDKISYENYKSDNDNPLTLGEFRKSHVNSLISSVYTAVKFSNKDLLFSVSPAADINKNKNSYFADIKAWCENGCVDIIIPQLYFGFEYPDEKFRFNNLLEEWKKLAENTDTKLVIGLASYKINTKQEPDNEEWQNGEEIIKRQTEICKNDKKVKGIVYFSYSNI
ncbi:MAG: family 10 glycosylhydrolase [Clostridia bacterium]|nr:family 10 glycosylhydrolase [Clostridia bacterium]